MVLKRQLREGAEGGSRFLFKRHHKGLSLFKGLNDGRMLQESVSFLEPMIRKIVQEAVARAIDPYLRISENQVNLPRRLHLQFCSNLPRAFFTNSRVLSEDHGPIRIALFDSITKEVITCGPLSSLKATVVVLDGDFGPNDREDWTAEEFDRKLVKTREGRRPLVTGELAVTLRDGVGCIGDMSFTDNSSWIRSGKFRLGVKVAASSAEYNGIKEAFSNAFKVKDHRGESYRKHHPPRLDDEVWRLEKIAKDGPSHEKLTRSGIYCVRDFLRFYFTDQLGLRAILHKATNKTWETIVSHAQKCALDDKKYTYTTAQGTGLLFNSVNKVIGITFDGRNYLPLNGLNSYQMNLLEHLKQRAYNNLSEWVAYCDPSIAGCPMLLESQEDGTFVTHNPNLHGVNFQEQEMDSYHPTMSSSPYIAELEQDNRSFEFGESSVSGQSLNPRFKNDYEMGHSPVDFYIGEHDSWASGGNYMGLQLSTDDLPLDDGFQVELPAWHRNGLFLDPDNHEVGIISSSSEINVRRDGRPKARWCKVLAVVKWRILARRHVAARKWKSSYGYF